MTKGDPASARCRQADTWAGEPRRRLALASVVASGENSQGMRPTVLVGDDLLRIFQEAKDDAEQVDPPEISLGTAFDPQPPQLVQTELPIAPRSM